MKYSEILATLAAGQQLASAAALQRRWDNGLGLTPAMGWSSWVRPSPTPKLTA